MDFQSCEKVEIKWNRDLKNTKIFLMFMKFYFVLSNFKFVNMKYLEVIDGVQAVDGRHTAKLQSKEQRAVVCARVAHILPHQHKLRPNIRTDSVRNNL